LLWLTFGIDDVQVADRTADCIARKSDVHGHVAKHRPFGIAGDFCANVTLVGRGPRWQVGDCSVGLVQAVRATRPAAQIGKSGFIGRSLKLLSLNTTGVDQKFRFCQYKLTLRQLIGQL
jgi:hypothetical protein